MRPFVECFWSVTTSSEVRHLVVPDGCLDIVYSARQGLRAVGAMTTAAEFPLAPGERIIGARFLPGRAPLFLKISAAELSDAVIPLETIWSARGRQLQQRLADVHGSNDLAVLSRALPVPQDGRSPVRAAIGAIARAGGLVELRTIAAQANLSPRQFRRRCLDEAGLTPRQLCRVLRFRNTLAKLECAAQYGWAQLALECGYCDQAHFIHEFRALSGYTPTAYLRRTGVPFLQSGAAPDA